MKTQDYCKEENPVALLIGHDPRLQNSDTIAKHALFADYYFKSDNELKRTSERKKKGLAAASFNQVKELSGIKPEKIYVTNLCNDELQPTKGTVLIPEAKAKEGFEHIKQILKDNPSIKYIFPMSCQVNYWLAYFGLYNAPDFVKMAKPCEAGVNAKQPHYQSKPRAFMNVCGRVFSTDDGRSVIPILHSKQYPLKSKMCVYQNAYDNIMKYFVENPLTEY